MKKSILFIGLVMSMMASAQVLKVQSVQQLSVPTGDVRVAGISPDGSFILLTSGTNKGLTKYDLISGSQEVLSTANGAGYNASIASDGQSVVYREKVVAQGNQLNNKLVRLNLQTRQENVLVDQTRSLGRIAMANQLEVGRPSVSIEDRQLVLTIGGTSRVLNPCGDASYLWPSVSPDGQKILFYVGGRGAYVCDMNGRNVKFLGRDLRAPKWYNNSVVIGMNDQDNGEVVTSSEIVAVSLRGKKQVLTNGINAMYPYACNGKIVCSGFNGETYLITVE
ncbi:MAG: PD40 domain-containing protein [Bacteroidales bacterium]|nr:PD40 domain-containing protein [Candidatus Colicola faecequi]